MKLTISNEQLFKPLQLISGAIERRQNLPILSQVLFQLNKNIITVTATDLEIELIGNIHLEHSGFEDAFSFTAPARKLMDICRALPNNAVLDIDIHESKLSIQAQRSRFSLACLSPKDFPSVQDSPMRFELEIDAHSLKRLMQKTCFAMAQQDVRYFFNGMLFEFENHIMHTVATDGHRLAYAACKTPLEMVQKEQALVPRKAILELNRLLSNIEGKLRLQVGSNHLRIITNEFTFITKLIDSRFPDYQRVIPKETSKVLEVDRLALKESLSRVAILSNERNRGVRLNLSKDLLLIQANNPEQEEAREELSVAYSGDNVQVGFNVNYLLDVLNVLEQEQVIIKLTGENGSALIQSSEEEDCLYVIMPLRL